MVGLFDSGTGGLNTVRYIKRHAPDVDLVYLIDRARAPYGIKTEGELVKIASENIERLSEMGAERVLIACCTASTVHELLPTSLRSISIPIISEVARRAEISTRIGRIGVIATNHTVNTHTFKDALGDNEVYELALPELVSMIDHGLNDATATKDDRVRIEAMLMPLLLKKADTLVLGCTHFPALKKTIQKLARPYGVRTVIDSAQIGAQLLRDTARIK